MSKDLFFMVAEIQPFEMDESNEYLCYYLNLTGKIFNHNLKLEEAEIMQKELRAKGICCRIQCQNEYHVDSGNSIYDCKECNKMINKINSTSITAE